LIFFRHDGGEVRKGISALRSQQLRETFQGFRLLASDINEAISNNISDRYLHIVAFMFGALFYHEDGDDMFLRNVS
jgi:hypothetical protein